MPIGLGIASSHLGALDIRTVEEWETSFKRFRRNNVPPPPEAFQETPEVLMEYTRRISQALGVLRDKLAEYQPDLLIMIGGDQNEMFDRSDVPNIMIYYGDTAWGYHTRIGPAFAGAQAELREEDLLRMKVDVGTSKWLLNKLVTEEGFDVAFSSDQQSLPRPGRGMPHAFYRPAPYLMPKLDVPIVMVYENTYDPPSLSAERCYELGQMLTRLFQNDSRRIAIYGSGGLSHDPGGPRAGWVDHELDEWFLHQLAHGMGRTTKAMYTFDGMAMRAGTGEVRSWITVAGAMEAAGTRATVVDYFPATHMSTGIGFAYWETPKA